MELHQLLRYLDSDQKISVYDIEKIAICYCVTKDKIPLDLYEERILALSIKNNELMILIEK